MPDMDIWKNQRYAGPGNELTRYKQRDIKQKTYYRLSGGELNPCPPLAD
ncbi:MAG: hypothetical protein JRC68_01120 [Deltaproteobacteria bacterium]|nr:hypothetical protein [Deltaproteobacteria bacterium]